MKTKRTNITTLAIAALLCCGMATPASASDVEARLSTREAYVGMPVVLQFVINNAEDYEQPAMPEIDGCDVRSAGVPSQSSQITIINGRRSASRSVTMQYYITPRRAGTFEIPSITVNVDGRDVQTRPQRFVATKSDTGDLMFVEIEGGQDKVFVGQPLDLTLKIWIKPYRDREKNITLSEANMWQMISKQTSWGSFADRLQELAENNQRPGGKEVLRDDGQGHERSYYLYEIKATVYPKRPGKIDADDVQIVVQYPTALGKSRDPFESFFKDSPFGSSPFGGNSRLSRLMNDDMFSSPFGNRLTVSATRPIVGEAAVDSTEVVPVPTKGRPADYRGAVGQYKIITQATPTKVNAGDPITLKIGIIGTGPMELVQAPPLAESSSLTVDFKVSDEPLAGFVQDETKVFSTTIRPRREGITQIPPISFSFFDPGNESFETVLSEPISISVDKADSLALSDIVGAARRGDDSQQAGAVANDTRGPDFSNGDSASLLVSQSAPSTVPWWWMFVVFPPVIWLATLLVRHRNAFTGRLPSFQSPSHRCLHEIGVATEKSEFAVALTRYIAKRSGIPCSDPTSAAGALRTLGFCSTANDVESFFSSLDRQAYSPIEESTLDIQQTAQELVEKMETSFADRKKLQVRRTTERPARKSSLRLVNGPSRKLSVLLFLAAAAMPSGSAIADDGSDYVDVAMHAKVTLTQSQQETILQEAHQAYTQASQLSDTDSAETKDLFSIAAKKYQLLVNSGIHNSQLYLNLGNACLQSGKLGNAIANYERGRQLDPDDRQLSENLEFANSLVTGNGENAAQNVAGDTILAKKILTQAQSANQLITNLLGSQTVIWILVASSLLFWGILIARACYAFPVWRFAIVPLLVLVMSAASYGLNRSAVSEIPDGVIVVNEVKLHAGDGEQFDAVGAIESAQGHRVRILAERGSWVQVRTAAGDQGWIYARDLEVVKESSS